MKVKFLLGGLSLVFIEGLFAGEIYTCNVNGSIVYQGKPCAGSKALADRVNGARQQEQSRELARHRYEVEMRERASRKPPSIGMSKSEAEKSSWGYPDKINTTTTATTEFEQWVYRGYRSNTRYLHFTNGKLTSISN